MLMGARMEAEGMLEGAGLRAAAERRVWRTLRPRPIRPSTGTPTRAARLIDGLEQLEPASQSRPSGESSGIAIGTVTKVGRDERGVVDERDPQRRVERRRQQAEHRLLGEPG
jgi:hypothetical protein